MTALPSKLERLTEMGPREIGHRLLRDVKMRTGRVAYLLRRSPEESDARLLSRVPRGCRASEAPCASYLRRVLASRFYPGAARAASLRALVARRWPGVATRLAADADRLLAHRVEILGFGEIDLGADIDWHRDPVTGATWDRRYWADYDLVHGSGAGDAKRIHEAGRHQHLPRLGAAYALTGDERYAREVLQQMLGFLDQCPAGTGVHWSSSLEIALRAISWLWALAFVAPSAAFNEPAARRIAKALSAHLRHVHRFPSTFTSPNTHLVVEAAALYVGGSVLAGFAGADAWRRTGQRLLADALDHQLCADGVHAELSPSYHCYALDACLQVLALARHLGRALPERFRAGASAMLDVLLRVARPDGSLPHLGDDDGGRALALAATSYETVSDLLCWGAVLLERGDLKAVAGTFPPEAVWLVGERGLRAYDALPASPPEALTAAFPDAGYVVHRSGFRPDDAHLIFDCGGLGKLGGGHGHADALQITLHAGGRELLVDPGTFTYHGQPWRDGFRSTRAHNTVVVDGRDQSEPEHAFRWRRPIPARLTEQASLDGLEYAAGEHDGYAALGIVHRRRLLYVRPDYWVVIDDFRGVGRHTFDLLYHLPPDAVVFPTSDGGDACIDVVAGAAGLRLFLHATSPLEMRIETGDVGSMGWVSARYGDKAPAPVLIGRLSAQAPAMIATVLAPRRRPAIHAPACRALAVPAAAASGGPAIGVGILHADGTEDAVLAASGRRLLEVGSWRVDGELLWARAENGRPARARAFPAGTPAIERRLAAPPPAAMPVRTARPVTAATAASWEECHVRHRGHP